MPEPIAIIKPCRIAPNVLELSQVYLSLRQSTRFICDSVEYKLDLNEYRERMIHARERRENDFIQLNNRTITQEEFNYRTESYVEDVVTHCLNDEDGKWCGTYNAYTKMYKIFLKRISLVGTIYYYDPIDREVYTYGGSSVGMLAVDGEFIEYDSISNDSSDSGSYNSIDLDMD